MTIINLFILTILSRYRTCSDFLLVFFFYISSMCESNFILRLLVHPLQQRLSFYIRVLCSMSIYITNFTQQKSLLFFFLSFQFLYCLLLLLLFPFNFFLDVVETVEAFIFQPIITRIRRLSEMSFILPIGDSLKHQNFERSLLTVRGFSLKGLVLFSEIIYQNRISFAMLISF